MAQQSLAGDRKLTLLAYLIAATYPQLMPTTVEIPYRFQFCTLPSFTRRAVGPEASVYSQMMPGLAQSL